jgi:hydroxysqualene dehydroxylase
MRVCIVGAGWAGLTCAVHCTAAGHAVTVVEAAGAPGGRARAVRLATNAANACDVDNGQHILIGAYHATLDTLSMVGVDIAKVLHRSPLRLLDPQGRGIALPKLPFPVNVVAGLSRARGWDIRDKWSLANAALAWRWANFRCAPELTVAGLCSGLSPKVRNDLIDPLCVSALNTPATKASASVFLRVMQDALFGGSGSSDLLLPSTDLSALFPQPCVDWLRLNKARLLFCKRVQSIAATTRGDWEIDGERFDAVVFACDSSNAARLARAAYDSAPASMRASIANWASAASALQFETISTVYLHGSDARLSAPMLALRPTPDCPAQFVFDRGLLGGPAGLLAFVVSANTLDNSACEMYVQRQAQVQLGLSGLSVVKTIVEKRATFACTPNLQRPPTRIAPGLYACGDYIDGPYPATLEGAVRSGKAAAAVL